MASAIDQHVQSALSEGYWDIAESPAEETAPSASSAKPRLKSLRRKVSKVFSAAERKTAEVLGNDDEYRLSFDGTTGLSRLKQSLIDGPDPAEPSVNGRLPENGDGILQSTIGEDLMEIARSGKLDALSEALAAGADVAATGPDGNSLLHCAASGGSDPAVAMLLEQGAAVDRTGRNGWTALHIACMNGYWQIAQRLLRARAFTNARATDLRTPLHFASEAGSIGCIRELLTAGADPKVADSDGRTPLHFATIDGDLECVQRLLGAGVDPCVRDRWGRDTFDIATQAAHAEILAALTTAAPNGAKRQSQPDSPDAPHPASASPSTPSSTATTSASKVQAQIPSARWMVMTSDGKMVEDPNDHSVLLFASRVAAARWAATQTGLAETGFEVDEVTEECWGKFKAEVPYKHDPSIMGDDDDDPLWAEFKQLSSIKKQGMQEGEEFELTRQLKAMSAEIEACKTAALEMCHEADAVEEALQTTLQNYSSLKANVQELEGKVLPMRAQLAQRNMLQRIQFLAREVSDGAASEALFNIRELSEPVTNTPIFATGPGVHGSAEGAKSISLGDAAAQLFDDTMAVLRKNISPQLPPQPSSQNPDSLLLVPVPPSALAGSPVTPVTPVTPPGNVPGPRAEVEGMLDTDDPIGVLSDWFTQLKIKREVSDSYAQVLVEDGFDSMDALETLEESDLLAYGFKKGHARVILKGVSKLCDA